MLKSVKDHIDGKINMEKLLLITEKEGFKDVVRALPIIGSKKITNDLYIDEMKNLGDQAIEFNEKTKKYIEKIWQQQLEKK